MERKIEERGHIFSDESEIVCVRRVGKNHTALEQRFVPGLGISGSQQNKSILDLVITHPDEAGQSRRSFLQDRQVLRTSGQWRFI